MAQAIKDKDVRKNCIDVEKVIRECISEPESKKIMKISEPVNSKELNKKLLKVRSEYNAKYTQELKDISRIKQDLVFMNYRNYAIY